MAKNTSSSAFRKIDVDQYNEDNFRDDENDSQNQSSGLDESEVNNLLNIGKPLDALKLVLSKSPLDGKNQAVKDSSLQISLKVLQSIKSSQVEEAVSGLNREELDILMKYIYKGFEYPSEGSSGNLLVWHEKAFAIGGLGSIIRVLTDRRKL